MNISDELVSKARNGDAKATTSIFNALFGTLINKGVSLGLDHEAEDAASTALTKVFANLEHVEFESAGRFVAWVYVIHHNDALSLLRKRAARTRKHTALFKQHNSPSAINPSENCAVRDELNRVLQFFAKNSTPKTRVMLGLDMIGCTNPEIADRTGSSLSAVKVRLFRARRKLTQLYS